MFSLAVEELLGVEMPPRATWIRMLMCELNRISSHVMWAATNGMDLASTTMMIFGFRERDMLLSFFEKTTGLRMNHNYIRPGGVAADLPDGWEDDVSAIVDTIAARLDDYDELLTGQPIFRERTEGVGIICPELALAHVRHRSDPARLRASPGTCGGRCPTCLRRGRLRRHRRHGRRHLRPLRGAPERDPRVDAASSARSSSGCPPATTGSRTRR